MTNDVNIPELAKDVAQELASDLAGSTNVASECVCRILERKGLVLSFDDKSLLEDLAMEIVNDEHEVHLCFSCNWYTCEGEPLAGTSESGEECCSECVEEQGDDE